MPIKESMREPTFPPADAADAFGARPRRWSGRRPRALLVVAMVCLGCLRLLLIPGVFTSVRDWLNIGSGLPNCSTGGFSTAAGREGRCSRYDGLFSSTEYNVVDRGHTLNMPEYDARLVASQFSPTRISGTSVDEARYPGRRALLVSEELTITNTSSRPLQFGSGPHAGAPFYPAHPQMQLLVPVEPGRNLEDVYIELVDANGAPGPSLTSQPPMPAHASVSGWVSFVVPVAAIGLLAARPADLDFARVGHPGGYVGQIRLWK
jgi:hypothetical protein